MHISEWREYTVKGVVKIQEYKVHVCIWYRIWIAILKLEIMYDSSSRSQQLIEKDQEFPRWSNASASQRFGSEGHCMGWQQQLLSGRSHRPASGRGEQHWWGAAQHLFVDMELLRCGRWRAEAAIGLPHPFAIWLQSASGCMDLCAGALRATLRHMPRCLHNLSQANAVAAARRAHYGKFPPVSESSVTDRVEGARTQKSKHGSVEC